MLVASVGGLRVCGVSWHVGLPWAPLGSLSACGRSWEPPRLRSRLLLALQGTHLPCTDEGHAPLSVSAVRRRGCQLEKWSQDAPAMGLCPICLRAPPSSYLTQRLEWPLEPPLVAAENCSLR